MMKFLVKLYNYILTFNFVIKLIYLLTHILRHIKLIIKNLYLDSNEIFFIRQFKSNNFSQKINSHKKKKYILIQTVTDYYYLAYYKLLFLDNKFSDYEIIGLWPYIQRTTRKRHILLEFLNEIYLYFYDYLEFLKWRKLYRSIGIKKFERLNFSILEKIYFKFTNKQFNFLFKDIFKYEINQIPIGDLLYDTYLRYRAQPTYLAADKAFIKKLIFKANLAFLKLNKINEKYYFHSFYTSYSSYLHHGIPVRFFLNKGAEVFSGQNNSQYNKRLFISDMNHTENYLKFKKMYFEIEQNKKLLNFSDEDLKLRFSRDSNNSMKYLQTDTYNVRKDKKINLKQIDGLDGIVFLQDFYDSPHCWGKIAFDDFYKWTIYTLNVVKKSNLKIGIKPHPNSWHNSQDSILVYERLKRKFPNVVWIDKDYPNKIIFNQIKFGISCTGTVLFELAYHGIKSICCGDPPGKDFNFTINAKTRSEYKNILLNINNIKLPNYSKNDLLIYNYLYYHSNLDGYENMARKLKLKNIDFSSSEGLLKFINIMNDYDYKN